MKKISIFKKLKLFYEYRKIIKKNEEELEKKFFVRKDKADRLYTVLNIPQEIIGEAYSLKKSDIDRISENFIKSYYKDLGANLEKMGLSELFTTYKVEKVGKYSYLLVVGFSLFRSNKYYNTLYYVIYPSLLILSGLLLFLFL
jgi:hypothetical protein